MDWRTLQFDWNRARAFLVTAEEGSFSAAARALDVSQPTVGRQVAALEDELGVALFERLGTGLQITETGAELLEHVRSMGESATQVSLIAAGQSMSVEGEVSITASEAISAFLLPPVLARVRSEYPGIEVEIVVSNEARDLQRREADIAVRNFQPTEPDLIGRRVGESRAYLYAAAAYLERVGPISTDDDLTRAELFAFDRTDIMIDGLRALGLEVARSQFPIVTGNHLVQWELCKQGVGICIMMGEVGEAEPRVQRVLPDVAIPVPIWLVSHRELRTNRRIRIVFDLLVEALAREIER